jgi:hypothetical protein
MPVLAPAPDAPIVVRKVTGLEPPDGVINGQGFGLLDGEFFTGSHIDKRNIVLTLGLDTKNAPESVHTARELVYAYLQPTSKVELRFTFTNRDPVTIIGYVETATGDRFDPNAEMQVSIICLKPFFANEEALVVEGVSGPTEYGGEPPSYDVPYSGRWSNGFLFQLHGFENGSDMYTGAVIIEHQMDGQTEWGEMRIDDTTFAGGVFIEDGWLFKLRTVEGKKKVWIENPDDGNEVSMLGYLDNKSYWMQLNPGLNKIRVWTPGTETPLDWSLTYSELFVGV